jgi:hypothetical protein
LALLWPVQRKLDKQYAWQKEDYKEEEDPFMLHFDANGNFIPESELQGEPRDNSLGNMEVDTEKLRDF